MTPDRWQQVKEIFDAAKGRDEGRRAEFLDDACAGDEAVRREVESLLASHDEAPSFMDKPAINKILAGRPRLAAGQRVGPFEVISLLGEGGMGEVYLANDTRLGRKVAIKLLPPYLTNDADRVRRFGQEARSASALNHPNILTIHEVGQSDGNHYIATEFVEGETLRARLERAGKLRLGEALAVATQIASALRAAHEAGVIHRDVKPENVMVRRDGLVKLLDFGLAKLAEGVQPVSSDSGAPTRPLARTAPGVVMGTVRYMSPEQARGLPVDERTDIWSLGCVLYEMVSGRVPFDGETAADVLISIIQAEPSPVLPTPEGVADNLNEVIGKTLRKKKEERYRSSEELLADLRRLERRLQLEAHPEYPASPRRKTRTGETKADVPGARHTNLRRFLASRLGIAFLMLFAFIAVAALVYAFSFREAPVPPPAAVKSLAVLPLKSLSNSKDGADDYLGVGIADTIITKVSQIGDLTVRPTSAVRKYAGQDIDSLEAARQLQADAVLDGTVQRAGERLRVSVNLLRASDGASLWAETFDLNFTDIFAIQDDVARQVAARLQRRLAPEQQARLRKRYTASAEAYEYYLKGNYSLDKVGIVRSPDLDLAVGMYKKAVEIDPQYALAYASLAYCYTWMALFTDVENPVWIERAKEELRRAESLNPELVELSAVRFQILYSKYGGYDIVGAYREIQRARQIDPNFGHGELGTIYDHSGIEDAALKELQRVLEIDPTSESAKRRLAESYELLVRPDDSIATTQRYFNEPGGVLSLLWKGRLDEAEAQINKSLPGHPEDVRTRSSQVLLRALQGRFREAEALIPAIDEKARETRSYHHVTYNFACAYAREGKAVEAVEWLRRTVDYGMPSYTLFERDPHLDRIRNDPAFTQFMRDFKTRWDGYRREFG